MYIYSSNVVIQCEVIFSPRVIDYLTKTPIPDIENPFFELFARGFQETQKTIDYCFSPRFLQNTKVKPCYRRHIILQTQLEGIKL